MNLNRTVSCLLTVALLGTLCACGRQAPSLAESAPSAGVSAQPAANPAGTSTNALQQLRQYTDAGYYAVGYNGSNQVLAYLDFDACQEVPLCTQPGCPHTDESCTACIPAGKGIHSVCAAGDTLLMVQADYEGGPFALVAADLNGGNRRQLALCPGGMTPDILAFGDGSAFYFLAMMTDGEPHHMFCRVPLSGGEIETLFKLPSGGITVLGASGRRLLLQTADYSAIEEYTKKYSGQYGSETERAAYAALKFPTRLFWKDVDTGEEREVDTWTTGQNENGMLTNAREICYTNDRIYWVDAALPEGAALHWIDANGQTGETPLRLPGSSEDRANVCCQMREPVNGLLQLCVTAESRSQRFLIDASTGAMTEIPLFLLSNGHQVPVPIFACTKTDLLVEYAEQMQDVAFLHEDGTPDTTNEVYCRYALISYEDFWAGHANYRDVLTNYVSVLSAGSL